MSKKNKKSGSTPLFVLDKSKKTNPLFIFTAAAAAVLMVYSVIYSSQSAQTATYSVAEGIASSDYIFAGVYLNDYPIGGLTRAQALERAQTDVADLGSWSFELFTPKGSYTKTVSFEDVGAFYDYEKSITEGYSYGRSGDTAEKAAAINELLNTHHYIDTEYGQDTQKCSEFIKSIEPEVNAVLEKYGEQMDTERLAEMINKNVSIKERDFNMAIPTKSL